MPLVAGGLLISLLLLLQVLGLLALHKTSLPLVRGLLGGWAEQKGFRRWFLRAIGAVALGNAIEWVVHRVRQAVARAALVNLDAVTLYLRDLGMIAHYTYKELGDLAPSWADSFAIFRHRTVPHAINTKVIPVKVAAAHAGALAGRSISLGNANRIRLGRSIDRLKKQYGLLAGILLGIDILVKGRHAARHHTDHAETIPAHTRDIGRLKAQEKALEQRLAREGSRLSTLEKVLGGLGLAGLLVRTIAKRWPWLFCRNWKKIGPRVCSMHTGLLDFLLGAGAAMFVFAELCQLIKLVGIVAARVLPKLIAPLAVAGAALCDGEHSAAPNLPLATTALPQVNNPLTF